MQMSLTAPEEIKGTVRHKGHAVIEARRAWVIDAYRAGGSIGEIAIALEAGSCVVRQILALHGVSTSRKPFVAPPVEAPRYREPSMPRLPFAIEGRTGMEAAPYEPRAALGGMRSEPRVNLTALKQIIRELAA